VVKPGVWGSNELRWIEGYIRGQLTRWIDDDDDLDDVTQECLRKAWSSLSDFRGDAKMTTWLYRIAHNEAISFLRRSDRREAAHDAWGQRVDHEPRRDLSDRVTDAMHVNRLMGRLPELDRRIVEMRFISGMTSKEIGDELQMAASSVRCRVNRLRENLRQAVPSRVAGPAARRLVERAVEVPLRLVPNLVVRAIGSLVVA